MNLRGLQIAPVSVLAVSLLALAGCQGGSKGDRDNRGPFTVSLISTGQGQIFPYRIRELVAGVPTTAILNIESDTVLQNNVAPNNPVLPVAAFPTTAVLPNGQPGNQFALIRFTHKLDVDSILSDQLADQTTNSGLTTAVSIIAEDANTEASTIARGRGFVGGYTYVNRGGVLELVQAVTLDDNGDIVILEPEAQGFPAGFSGDEALVQPNSFVFVADTNGSLLPPYETFDPGMTNRLLRFSVTSSVRDTDGGVLEEEACTATTVGADPNPPNVIGWTGNRSLEMYPTMGSLMDTDPETQFVVRFNKPVQPADVGTFFSTTNRTPLPGGMRLNITLQASNFDVQYYADPFNWGDYCNFRITPAYTMPDSAQATYNCTASSIRGLQGANVANNQTVPFTTGVGPGVINAPVAPDAIYIGIGGAQPGLSVIDLNGYGQSTSSADPLSSNFALGNPNVGIAGVTPSLSPGTSGLDAGSKGLMTLVEDSRGDTILLGAPTLGQVGDIHLGAPLDLVYNNANINVNASGSNQVNPATSLVQPGNCIAVAPHPNPPKLVYPPPNLSQLIFGEPPSVTTGPGGPPGVIITANPPCAPIPVNQLNSASVIDYYQRFAEGVFYGPQPPPGSPPPPPPFCPFTSRQQIGHFMYVLDQENDQILVLNSNRFTVLDVIRLTDPFSMAFAPSLALMAVTNFASSTVSFIDTDPRSPSFNQIVAETRVAQGPTGVAWQPDGEAILVLSTEANTLSVLTAGNFEVVTEVSGNLNRPFELAVTERYVFTGNQSAVYYAYILNANGTVAVYESGPSGVNGFGYDDVIGLTGQNFRRARAIRIDPQSQFGGVYVCHVDDSGLGQVSRLELTATPLGLQPTNQISGNGLVLPPTFRQKEWTVTRTYGGFEPSRPSSALLSGNAPVDLVLDEMLNNAAFPNQNTPLAQNLGLSILGHSSKGTLMNLGGGFAPATNPRFLFVALADAGVVDVFDINTTAKFTSIPVSGVTVLSTYFRQ